MLKVFALLGLVVIAGCEPITPAQNACLQAQTYGQMFGTPENRGPCWGRVVSTSQTADIRVYLVEMPVPGYSVAGLTYQGNRLIQAGVTTQ